MSYTAQQGAGATLYAGNTTISGAQWTDNVWQITQPTIVAQAHQSGQNTYLYFLCADQGSITTASNAIGSNIARTYQQPTASIADLTTSLQSTNKYFQITRFRDAEGGDYPPNDGGSQALALYVVLMGFGGTTIAQTTAYRCFSVTLQYQADQSHPSDISVPGSGISITEPTSSSQQAWSRTVTGTANDLNIYYLSKFNQSSRTQMTSPNGGIARTYNQNATRQWGNLTSSSSSVLNTFLSGHFDAYYIYTRTTGDITGADVTDATSIAQNANRIWDGNYYRSNSVYSSFRHTEVDDQINVSSNSGFSIQASQGQNTSTQFQIGLANVGQAGGQHTYAFFTSNTSSSGQTHGVTTVASTAANTPNIQITLSNANGAFPDVPNTNEQFYIWAKHPQDTSQTYFFTGQSVQINVADNVPDNPVLSPSIRSGAQANTTYTSTWTTLGVGAGVQVQWQATGQGSPQLSTDNVNWSTSISRELQQQAYLRMTSGSAGTTRTADVVYAQDTSVKDTLSISTSAGGGSQGGGSAQNYGLEIYESGGQTVIIDGSSRIGGAIATQSIQFTTAQSGSGSTGQHVFSGIDCQDDNKFGIMFRTDMFNQFNPAVQLTRRTAAQQYGVTVRAQNAVPSNQSPQSVDIWLFRF